VFPVIDHLDEILTAISGREEFMVHRNDELGFASVLYRYTTADTFPDPEEPGIGEAERRRRQLVRECRGITFDLATGAVIARKFHKFFNIGEREETLPQRIDWTVPHIRLVKADGSLMTPLLRNDRVRWASKMGVTKVSEPVEAFVEDRADYVRLAYEAAALGATPQFEWCSSAAQRIILDYPEASLILLALRDNQTGRYWPQPEVEQCARDFGVPCITRLDGEVSDHVVYLRTLSELTGIEGEVVVFQDGRRYKAKTAEYLRMHRALAGLVQEKDVLALVLSNELDDVKALLSFDLASRLDAFADGVNRGLDRSAIMLALLFRDGYAFARGDRKRFAVDFARRHPEEAPFLFALWPRAADGDAALVAAARELLVQQVAKSLGSATRVDHARRWFGADVRWTAEIPDLDA
jgi:T4 RnlA family RNA ligase